MLHTKAIARALGGESCGDQISCPGPGHRAKDRSLSVKIDPHAPDGFVVNSFAGNDPIACRDYVRGKLGMAPFKPRKREPSFSVRRRAWRDKLMVAKVRSEFKVVGYLLSYHANHKTCTTLTKASSIARESGIGFATVRKALDWLEKSGFIKTGRRDDGTPYATLKLGNIPPRYLFAAGPFHIARLFAACQGGWLDQIFLSTDLSAGDKLTAYAVAVSLRPRAPLTEAGKARISAAQKER